MKLHEFFANKQFVILNLSHSTLLHLLQLQVILLDGTVGEMLGKDRGKDYARRDSKNLRAQTVSAFPEELMGGSNNIQAICLCKNL